MARLRTPVICTVIGEGGSGGALAIGVGDRTLMLQYSTYSVISPEGCASILWKSAEKAADAAEALGITSTRLSELGLVDQVISEPLGGAHRDVDATAGNIKEAILATLETLEQIPPEELIEARYKRLMACGQYSG
jgi:acetyl-CoA carboxylase carboxyl transferase subunit alpha